MICRNPCSNENKQHHRYHHTTTALRYDWLLRSPIPISHILAQNSLFCFTIPWGDRLECVHDVISTQRRLADGCALLWTGTSLNCDCRTRRSLRFPQQFQPRLLFSRVHLVSAPQDRVMQGRNPGGRCEQPWGCLPFCGLTRRGPKMADGTCGMAAAWLASDGHGSAAYGGVGVRVG